MLILVQSLDDLPDFEYEPDHVPRKGENIYHHYEDGIKQTFTVVSVTYCTSTKESTVQCTFALLQVKVEYVL